MNQPHTITLANVKNNIKTINITWVEGSEYDEHEGKAELNAWHNFKVHNNEIDFITSENLSIADDMVKWFVDNEGRIYSLVCDYVNKNYQDILDESEIMDVFDDESPTYDTNLGEMSEADMLSGDIFKLMEITRVDLYNPEKNTIGVFFECAWDEEHGFELLIQDNDIIL